jgi:hypothetical protein
MASTKTSVSVSPTAPHHPLASGVFLSVWEIAPKGLSKRTAEETAAAKSADRASHERLRAVMKRPENRECADCTARLPGWGVLPHGVFVCTSE